MLKVTFDKKLQIKNNATLNVILHCITVLARIEYWRPVTVPARSKAWTVFSRSNAGIVSSNPTQGMDVCLCLFCVSIGSGFATGWSPIQGVLPTVLGLRNWSETKRFTDALCSKVGATGKRERERILTLSYTVYVYAARRPTRCFSVLYILSYIPYFEKHIRMLMRASLCLSILLCIPLNIC
jgi:hypothetical protein